MKKTLFLYLIIVLLVMTLINCNKDKNSLPPETQTGANTFGCLLNGQVFKPKGGGIAPIYDCYYQHLSPGDSGYIFHVSGNDNSNTEKTEI